MAKPSDYLIAAAVSQMRSADNSALETLDDLKNAIESEFAVHLIPDRLAFLARSLERYGFIQITNDDYAGDYITPLSGWGVSYRLNKIKDAEPKSGLLFALDRGSKLLNRAFSNEKFWTDLDTEIEETPDEPANAAVVDNDEIPASDRVVKRSDNRVEIEVLEADIRSIVEEIDSSNEIGAELGEEKEVISGELKAAETLVAQPVFRHSTLSGLVIPVLRYLMEKFAAGAVGELAKRLITAILGLG